MIYAQGCPFLSLQFPAKSSYDPSSPANMLWMYAKHWYKYTRRALYIEDTVAHHLQWKASHEQVAAETLTPGLIRQHFVHWSAWKRVMQRYYTMKTRADDFKLNQQQWRLQWYLQLWMCRMSYVSSWDIESVFDRGTFLEYVKHMGVIPCNYEDVLPTWSMSELNNHARLVHSWHHAPIAKRTRYRTLLARQS
jgi:hypothetical protein